MDLKAIITTSAKLPSEDEVRHLRRLVQDALVDELRNVYTTGQARLLMRNLARFPPHLWPYTLDIPEWVRTQAEKRMPYFNQLVKMVELRMDWEP